MKLTRPEPITNPRGNPDQDAAIERETQMDAMRKTIARLTEELATRPVKWTRGNGCTYTIPMPLDGWTLTPTAFDYAEAMRRVADGKRLRRRAWQPNLLYVSLSPCSKVYMEHYEDGYTRNGVTSREDILATDWHEVGG